ncbi:16900_t:CDS:2 [Acaulospora colombiana]|uniref:16900_t:CDS:1 n=1 Tax=Acaulospora colombiana TaxID=27376 RepID=A0ACA9K6F6_9GLOM|nr:16900_t:CDS:2 [Acaulospora colombiana]
MNLRSLTPLYNDRYNSNKASTSSNNNHIHYKHKNRMNFSLQ